MESKEYINGKVKELEGFKQRKLTKAEKSDALIKIVAQYTDEKLKEGRILNMQQGFELANQMMLDYINDGNGIDEVKSFIEKNLSVDGRKAMDNVLQLKTVANEESN
jgi:urease gamma subunit